MSPEIVVSGDIRFMLSPYKSEVYVDIRFGSGVHTSCKNI